MEQKSDEETSDNQPAESQSESESNGEAEKSERDTETPTTLSDKRKLKAKEQKYVTFTAVCASKESVALSPTKRKCTERHVIASGNIKPGEKVKADEPKSGTTAASIVMQGSPRRSPTMPETSAAGVVMKGSPQRSPKMPGTSAAGVVMKGSPQRSPTMPGISATSIVMQGSPQRSPTMPGTSAAGVLMQSFPQCLPTIPRTSAVGVVMQGSPQRSPMMPETSAAGVVMQGSPKRSPTMPGTSVAGGVMQGSPQRSPTMPGTSAAGIVMQGSPQRSPTKRTYKEIYPSYNVDELVEKRLKEESGHQSDTALDLRKDFKKQIPSSTQSPELDCQPTSSDKTENVGRQPEEKYETQSNFPRDPKSASSEVTSSDGAEADVSSTSNESVTSTIGLEASSVKGSQVQNIAEANKPKPNSSTSPQQSGARPKEAAGGSRSVEYIEVSYPRFSPSRCFYGEPTIRRISPPRAGPSGSGSGGGFKVPPPPPPLEERDEPIVITNALEKFHSTIVNMHAIVSAQLALEQQEKEEEEKARKEQESAKNFERAKLQARETTKKLREKEARLKEGANQSESGEKKSDTAPDEAVAGPSTPRGETTGYGPEENIEVETSVDKRATPPGKEEHKITEPIAGREQNLPVAHQSMRDENANIMEGGPSRSPCKDDNATKSEPCTVQTDREGTDDDARPSTSGVSTPRPQQTPRNREYLSLQQLVPQIGEISLDDSFENVAIADSEQEDDNVDLQNT